MSRKRTSVVWTTPKEEFAELIKNSKGIGQALAKLGLMNKGANFRTLKKRILEDGIDSSHFKSSTDYLNSIRISRPIEDILTENSSFNRSNLKKRLLKELILKNECYVCELGPKQNDADLSLQIDHINGISNDNRLCNLRIICPNCHSQTSTFAGKKLRLGRVTKSTICACGNNKAKSSAQCRKCYAILQIGKTNLDKRKVEIPSKEDLAKLVWEISTVQIAKRFGVSDKSIEKWCKAYGISKPPKGYWGSTQGMPINKGKYKFSLSQVQHMFDYYLVTNSFRATGRKFKLDNQTIKKWFKKFKLI